jgi:hypothetical protein
MEGWNIGMLGEKKQDARRLGFSIIPIFLSFMTPLLQHSSTPKPFIAHLSRQGGTKLPAMWQRKGP